VLDETSGADAALAQAPYTTNGSLTAGIFDATGERQWRRSSRCSTNSCVEVSRLAGDRTAIRDSKAADGGPVLVFTAEEWRSFTLGVKAGEFD
jgi:Domain of unknown function (DUF397)